MFKQAKQNRAFEDVVSQIQEAILDGRLKEGDKLPNERSLKEIFRISRGTLREALRGLEQKGLIIIKTGVHGGTIVCPVDTKLLSESLDLLLRHQKVTLEELAGFREAVEPVVAAQAAKKATGDDIDKLRILLESIGDQLNSAEPKWDELIEKDTKFHLTLTQIAGNRIFESVLNTIYSNINHYFDEFLPRDIKILKRIHKDFGETVRALEKGDSNQASKIMLCHVKRFNQKMRKRKRERDRGLRVNNGLTVIKKLC